MPFRADHWYRTPVTPPEEEIDGEDSVWFCKVLFLFSPSNLQVIRAVSSTIAHPIVILQSNAQLIANLQERSVGRLPGTQHSSPAKSNERLTYSCREKINNSAVICWLKSPVPRVRTESLENVFSAQNGSSEWGHEMSMYAKYAKYLKYAKYVSYAYMCYALNMPKYAIEKYAKICKTML